VNAAGRPALPGSQPGGLHRTAAKAQQVIASLSEISKDIKELLALFKESTRKQGEADEKAYGQLVNIAHKR